jgi:hypothetical protein
MSDRISPYGLNRSVCPTTGASTTVSAPAYAGNTSLRLPKVPADAFAVAIKNDATDGTVLSIWGDDHLTVIDSLAQGSPNTQAAGVTKTYTYKLSNNSWATS